LLQAHRYAQDAGSDEWDFALEINRLYESGMTINELRWLVAKQLVRHGRETTVDGDSHRSFQPHCGLNFTTETCLILTPAGVEFTEGVGCGSASIATGNTAFPRINSPTRGESNCRRPVVKPHWNSVRRELWLDDTLVKCFRVRAANQEIILSAFEEEGWPPHIDDPLPAANNIDPGTRLHDAIYRLNSCQKSTLLRFRGNGNANGIFWEQLKPDSAGQQRGDSRRQTIASRHLQPQAEIDTDEVHRRVR
jgi:hypothetical protein